MTGAANLRDTVKSLTARTSVRWTALILIAATIVGTAVHSYRRINDELTAVTLLRREAIARLAAATLAEKFGRLVDVAISLATRQRVQELVGEEKWVEAIGFLRNVPQDLPHIERLFLADTKGTLQADVPALPGVRGINFASREWFQGVSRVWRPYVSPVYTRAAVPQLNVFAVAVPVKSAKGSVAGILVLQIRIDSLTEWVEAINIGPQGFIHIVDSKGQAAFDSRQRKPEGIADMSRIPVVQKLRQGEHGVEIAFDPAEREDSIVAYAAVPEYGWGVIAQQPSRASLGLAARDEQLRRLLTGYGLILALGAAATFLASRIAVERRRSEDDRRMKVELEQRVVERTEQLARTNDALRGEIAERTRAENKFRNLLESAPDIIILVDRKGRIALVNSQAEHCFGYVREELIGQPIEILIPERLRIGHVDHREKYLATPRARPMGTGLDLHGHRKDGSEFPVEISLSPTETAEGVLITSIIRDVTQRRQAERRIHELNESLQHRARELELTNKELETFSYSVSHDLRAPLRGIDGFSQALIEDYGDKLDDQGKDYLQRVRSATQRMGLLIDDLLKLSRATRAELRRESVDLNPLAQGIMHELQRTKPERVVEFSIEAGLNADGDARLLRIVLENLLGNAWKFTGKTPRPLIELGSCPGEDGTCVFYVRDNGVGFDMVYADKLFGAFQRLHAPAEFPGTGIGLATVQRIVHRHGGRVWAEGQVNRGATFYFTLPTGNTISPAQPKEAHHDAK